MTPLLEGRSLVREFAGRSTAPFRRAPRHRALDGVSIALEAGETLGVVGESGSGKLTLARLIAGILTPTLGEVRFRGKPLPARGGAPPGFRRAVQLVFQDPHAALNPRRTVRDSLALPRRCQVSEPADATEDAVVRTLERVGLAPFFADRFPHELSGGQAQRVGIARALIVEPEVVILDEALASLDLATQQQVVELLLALKASLGLAYLFISHDLPLVAELCDRALVMRAGRVVEEGGPEVLLDAPEDPYTRELAAAVPVLRTTSWR